MFNNEALDVVIGLVFIYLLYSLLATIISEIVATKFSFRAKFLSKAIVKMLDDDAHTSSPQMDQMGLAISSYNKKRSAPNLFTDSFYNHPLIKVLGEKIVSSKPAYIISETFSKVVIDLLRGDKIKAGDNVSEKIQEALSDGKLKWGATDTQPGSVIKSRTLSYLTSIWIDAQGDVEKFRELLERWFNETMDRTSGWYKKYTQYILMVIGIFIAVIFNVNTIEIAGKLQRDPKLREQIVMQADAFLKAHPNLDEELEKEKLRNIEQVIMVDSPGVSRDVKIREMNNRSERQYDLLREKRDSLVNLASGLVEKDLKQANELLGIGIYSYQWTGWSGLIKSIVGWLVTALALSLGAPFWFDLLNKLMKVRGAVAPPSPAGRQKNEATKIHRVG